MKKKIISILLLFVLVFSMSVPVFAAEQTKKKTDKQIIADIEKIYGIAIILDEDNTFTEDAPLTKHLTKIEKGLAYLGSGFTKKIASKYEPDAPAGMGKFRIHLKVTVEEAISGRVKPDSAEYSDDGTITIYANQVYPARIYAVVHEFGHALDDAAARNGYPEPYKRELYTEKGKWNNKASEAPDRFASSYAEVFIYEDYAETFAQAVINGADNPLKYGKDTIIYKKTLVVYNDLVEFAGKKALATKRVAGYLGI